MFPDFSTYEWPAWASSEVLKMWLAGVIVAAMVQLFRAALRWFRAVGTESNE